MLDNETITIDVTVIGGERYADDYTVIWRDLSIGRIRKNLGLPAHVDQWSWGCNTANRRSAAIADRAPILRTANDSSRPRGRAYAPG